MNVKSKVLQLVRHHVDTSTQESIEMDMTIAECELDSLAVFEIVYEIEECFGIDLDESRLAAAKTLRDFADLVEAAIRDKGAGDDPDPPEPPASVPVSLADVEYVGGKDYDHSEASCRSIYVYALTTEDVAALDGIDNPWRRQEHIEESGEEVGAGFDDEAAVENLIGEKAALPEYSGFSFAVVRLFERPSHDDYAIVRPGEPARPSGGEEGGAS